MKDFPAYAGIFPSSYLLTAFGISLPRERGDLSNLLTQKDVPVRSSPRERGSFWKHFQLGYSRQVFPARAGIVLNALGVSLACIGLPRACGDRSQTSLLAKCVDWSSLRAQGSFHD